MAPAPNFSLFKGAAPVWTETTLYEVAGATRAGADPTGHNGTIAAEQQPVIRSIRTTDSSSASRRRTGTPARRRSETPSQMAECSVKYCKAPEIV